MKRDQVKVRVIGPDQLETRDIIRDPDALECLSKNRVTFLRKAHSSLVTEIEDNAPGQGAIWSYGPSWAVAVLDEIWSVRHSYETTVRWLLRRAATDMTVRDAVIAATLAGGALHLARHQR